MKVKRRGAGVLPACLIILLVATLITCNRLVTNSHQRQLLENLSRLDFSGTEPQVGAKIRNAEQEVRKDPQSAHAWGKLGMNLDAHDFTKESIPIYKEAAALDSSEFRWPYFCAIALDEIGSDECLQWYARAKKIKGDYAPLMVKYADALFHYGGIDQAVEQYRNALQADPRSAHAYYGLAQISFAKADMTDSRSNLQKAFELEPSFAEAYSLLATVCRRTGDVNCAEQAAAAAKNLPEKSFIADPVYEEVSAEGVSSLWYRARGSDAMKQRAYVTAIEQFRKAIRIRPDIQTHEDLARALSAAGRNQEAIAEYETVVGRHPTARNYFGLALVYARTGRFDQAENLFRRAIEKKPDMAEAYYDLAVVLAKTGRLQQTIETLQQAIAIKPDYTEAHYHLALAFLAANNKKAAREEYQQVVRLDPNAGRQLQRMLE